MKRQLRKTDRGRRTGVAALELALVLPIFLIAVFGILEFGRAMMVQQILTNAAREGARRAVVPGATDEQVTTLVQNYLAKTTVSTGMSTVNPSLATAQSHDAITVVTTVNYSDVGFGLMDWISPNATFGATVTMRKE